MAKTRPEYNYDSMTMGNHFRKSGTMIDHEWSLDVKRLFGLVFNDVIHVRPHNYW